ncbi:MAG: 50S ribosomal protein L31e [archaeon]
MADTLERSYNIPLRKGFMNTPRYKRTKKAVATLKEFLLRHMKAKELRIGKALNEKLWENGIKNPPHHVKVACYREAAICYADLEGNDPKKVKVEKKEKEKKQKSKIEEMTEKIMGEKKEKASFKKKEETPEAPAEAATTEEAATPEAAPTEEKAEKPKKAAKKPAEKKENKPKVAKKPKAEKSEKKKKE